MAFLTYRASSTPTLPTATTVKSTGLTNADVDGNFGSLDSAKYEKSGGTISGDVTITGNLTINGTTTTINAATLTVDDINIELGSVTSPTDATANGGGITLKGATDKTIIWDNTNSNWTSSEHLNIATGKTYKINNTTVLSASALGSTVLSSSLTSVGTLTNLTVTNTIIGSINGTAATVTTNANLTGDVTSIGNATTLATVNTNVGTFNNVTVNAKGLVTAASNVTYLTSYTESDTLATVTGRGATTATAISITNSTAATTTTTGALQVTGGVGIQGALYVGSTIDGTTFNSTSDARLKSEIEVIENALDKTLSLSGYTFLLNSDKSKRQTGVIAQEVLKVLPEAVSGTEDTHYSVSYGNIVGLLIEAIKELNTKVTDLQNQLANK